MNAVDLVKCLCCSLTDVGFEEAQRLPLKTADDRRQSINKHR